MGHDVTIEVPPAVAMYGEDAHRTEAELRDELAKLRTLASTLTNVVCSFLKMDDTHIAVVPRAISDSVRGARVRVAETADGDVFVEWNERTSDLIVIEGGGR